MKISNRTTTSQALYYENSTYSKAKIKGVFSFPEGLYVCTDMSPFHPEDYLGGDQPGDKGKIVIQGKTYKVEDSRIIIIDINTRKNVFPKSKSAFYKGLQEGIYIAMIGHFIIDDLNSLNENSLIDLDCELYVDEKFRENLSKTHTTVHLMSIILNEELASFWKKEVDFKDDLNNPNFDALAIQKSKIYTYYATDVYRIGKSLSKKGFDLVKFKSLDFKKFSIELSSSLNKLIDINKSSKVSMFGDNIQLGAKRNFKVKINDRFVTIPCGGTHVSSLSQLPKVTVDCFYNEEEKTLSIKTQLI